MVQNWAHDANGMVDTILRTANNHLLAGGQFTSINGSSRKYYVSLNLSTGPVTTKAVPAPAAT